MFSRRMSQWLTSRTSKNFSKFTSFAKQSKWKRSNSLSNDGKFFCASIIFFPTTIASAFFLLNESSSKISCDKIERERSVNDDFIEKIRVIVGNENVTLNEEERSIRGNPQNYYTVMDRAPDIVAFPQSTEEVSAIVALCHEKKVPIIPFGGGTSLEGQLLTPAGGVSLDFSKMKKVLSISPTDFDVTVEAGIGYIELNEVLKELGLWFPLDPGPGASIGGMSACRCSGSTAVKYGTMRENVLSLTAVLPNGRIIKTGARARKSAAGYDLTRLLVGSEGTLAVITEATLKVYKIPKYSAAMRIAFESVEQAARTVQETLSAGIPIGRAELMDDVTMKIVNYANGTDYQELTTVLFELAGETSQYIEEAMKEVEQKAKAQNCLSVYISKDSAECKEIWRQRKEVFWSGMGYYHGLNFLITDVCVPLSRLPDIIGKVHAEVKSSWLPAPIVAHAGDGNIHCIIYFDTNIERDRKEAERLSHLMVEWALSMEGTCTGEHGVGYGKVKYMSKEFNDATLSTMAAIKNSIDPDNIMNPGKILPSYYHPETGKITVCS